MKKILLLTFMIFLTGIFHAQVYPAMNMTLASVIDPEPGTGFKYSACYGWYQQSTGKEYAIACSKNGTYWIDVTNPFSPTVCAYKAGASSNGTWRECKTYGNYCYVVCDDNSSTGFQIFDMSTLPATVTLVSQNQNLFRRGHAAWVDGNRLYVSGVTYSTGNTPASSSMDVYSLATPSAPVLLRRLSQDYPSISYVHDEFVRNDTVFASCGYQGLWVYRFNPGTNTFTQLGSLTSYTASGYNHATAWTPDRKTLVMMDEVPAALPIKIVDVQNLSNMQVLTTCNQYTQTTPHNPFMVSNRYCFASSYRDGTQLWDISSPSSPSLAAYFDTYPQFGGNNNNWGGSAYDGQWSMYPFFPSRNIMATDEYNGVFMMRTHLYSLPEINVQGNAINIADGTNTTSLVNSTNYGTVNVGSNLSHTFSIQNTGLDTLKVSSISVTGAAANEFTLSGLPGPSFTVAPVNGTRNFTVVFTPTASGTRSAQITINNNDTNEGTYDFVVDGDGRLVQTGIATYENADFRFFVFPNPVKTDVEFNIPRNMSDADVRVDIYDGSGRLVLKKEGTEVLKSGNNLHKINLSNLDNAIYSMVVFCGDIQIASTLISVIK